MLFNIDWLQEEINTAGIPGDAGYGYVTFHAGATDPQKLAAADIIANHNPALLSTRQKANAAYAGMTTANTGRLKYFPYFVTLQNEYLAVMSDPALTEQQCFTRLLAALKQDKATNADHLFAYNMFLRESSRTNNVNVTDAVLTALAYPARRTFYAEVKDFMNTGLLAGLSVILKNGNGG